MSPAPRPLRILEDPEGGSPDRAVNPVGRIPLVDGEPPADRPDLAGAVSFQRADPLRVDAWAARLNDPIKYDNTPAQARILGSQYARWERDWPELRAMFDEDFDRALRMTDDQRIFASMESAMAHADGTYVPTIEEMTYN